MQGGFIFVCVNNGGQAVVFLGGLLPFLVFGKIRFFLWQGAIFFFLWGVPTFWGHGPRFMAYLQLCIVLGTYLWGLFSSLPPLLVFGLSRDSYLFWCTMLSWCHRSSTLNVFNDPWVQINHDMERMPSLIFFLYVLMMCVDDGRQNLGGIPKLNMGGKYIISCNLGSV